MNKSVMDIKKAYNEKNIMPKQVIEACFKNIKNNDIYNSFISITEDLAAQKLEKLQNKNSLPLYGIPVSFKDSIDIKGYYTTNGANRNKIKIAKSDANIVTLFQNSGAVIIGKNNLYEFSTGVFSNNSVYGNVVNPRNHLITAGGSSSGSAAAVASGLVPCSIGTDTSGSIRIPAACCEVVGFKFGYNRDLLRGITPMSNCLDHVGIITNNTLDAEMIFNSIFGIKNSLAVKGDLIIGIPKGFFDTNLEAEVSNMMGNVHSKLHGIKYNIIEIDTSFLTYFDPVKISRMIGTPEMTVNYSNLDEENENVYSDEIKETFKRAENISSIEYLTAINQKKVLRDEFDEYFKIVDVILTPTMPIITPHIHDKEIFINNNYKNISDVMVMFTSVFNLTGHPTITIPSGYYSRNISQGIQLVSNFNNEDKLFEIAKLYEEIRENSLK